MRFLAKGKRSIVYQGAYKGKPCAIKVKREDSNAQLTLEKEHSMLKRLNPLGIGPKIFRLEGNKLFMELIEGERILDFFKTATREQIIKVLEQILRQLRTMDKARLEKGEMTNPYKHIIIQKGHVKMIDFERCRPTERPSNITQFLNFLTRKKLNTKLAAKGVFIVPNKMKALGRLYKARLSEKNYTRIRTEILQRSFATRVYLAASRIPRGKVASYKQLAHAIGSRGYRAVGQAMHNNPFWPIVPCHRVINSNGALGGFGTGIKEKIQLMKDERIPIENKKIPREKFTTNSQLRLSGS